MLAVAAIAVAAVLVVGGYGIRSRPADQPSRSTAGPLTSAAPTASAGGSGPARPTPAAAAVVRTRPPSGGPVVPDGWPTPGSTGWRHTGATLAPYRTTGDETVIRTAGTVVDGADIRARVRVAADNVTIRRSRITGTGCASSDGCPVLSIDTGRSGLLVEDVEITRDAGAVDIDRAVVLAGAGGRPGAPRAVLRRVHVHATYRGVLVGDHTIVEHSYVEDQDRDPPADAHTSAISAHGADDVVIRHNTVGLTPNDVSSGNVALYGDDAPLQNILIEDNLFNGGSACLWLTTDFRRGRETFVTIRNNLFGRKYHTECGSYYPVHLAPDDAGGPNFTWAGNMWYAPGAARHGSPVPPG